ncbi:MAG: DNA repair protein RecN [Candidatus Sumerlaeia bacterium]|nr:DNA repair protein RecN [Candidatus Sumerlaeia bacterium]
MLTLLRIRNLAVVESLELEFGPGLNALTGESGAGKSVVLEALGLLLGERAQPGAVRPGAEAAEVEGCFDFSGRRDLCDWLAEQGLTDDEGEVIVRREVQARGKSRSWINGRLATVGQLAALGERVAEVHGQHASQALATPASQRALFDGLTGLVGEAVAVESAWSRLAELRAECETLELAEREARQRLDFLRFQIAEIEELALEPGEDESLRAERDRLAHVDALGTGVGRLRCLTEEGESESAAAADLLGQALHELEGLARLDATLAPLAAQLEGVTAQLADVIQTLSSYADRLEADPERLHVVEGRLHSIRRLERKYGCGVEGILSSLAALREEEQALAGRDQRRAELDAEIGMHGVALAARAQGLSAARRQASKGFVRRVQELVRGLALPGARFEVAFLPAGANAIEIGPAESRLRVGPEGAERVEFRFSANEGVAPTSLGAVASGGELSRLMLALHVLSAEREGVPVLVFDEIDTGLSGAASQKLAAMLAELGRHRQVLCVTHQPLVASRAVRHFALRKESRRGRTMVRVAEVCGDTRRAEVARLLDGGASPKSLELAGEMLLASA